MPRAISDILFPLGGVNRSLGFQSQAPYSTLSACNTWPRDTLEQRLRGGSRPGLVRVFPTSPSSPSQLLANVRVGEITAGYRQQSFIDEFNVLNMVGENWTNANWSPYADKALFPPTEEVYPLLTSSVSVWDSTTLNSDHLHGALVTSLLGMDASEPYSVKIRILPDARYIGPGLPYLTADPQWVEYSLFARLNDDSPNVRQSGALGYVSFTGDQSSNYLMTLYLELFTNGEVEEAAQVLIPNSYVFSGFATLTLGVVGNVVTVVFDGGSTIKELSLTASAPVGSKVGFGITSLVAVPTVGHRYHRVDQFRAVYQGRAALTTRNVLVAAGGVNASAGFPGDVDLRFEDLPGELTEAGAHTDYDSTTYPNTNGHPLMGVQLLGDLYIAGDGPKVWKFDATGTGTLSLLKDFGIGGGGAATIITSLAVWRSRLCVVTDDLPHNISMAKVGDPTDWDFKAIPTGSAVRLNTSGIDTGELADAIFAIIPFSDDYLVIGGRNSLHVLRGDPTYGSQIDKLSGFVGIVGQLAWTLGPNTELLWVSDDGVYGLPPGILARPESISREKLPREMVGLDTDQYRVMAAFDLRNRGMLIAATPKVRMPGYYFWFDWETKGFWPLNFNIDHQPMTMVYQDGDSPGDQRLLLGCRDGVIRTFDLDASNDDGVVLSSEYFIGPLMLGGGGYHDGMLLETIAQLGSGSEDVTMEVKVGDSVEAAWNAAPRDAITLKAGKNLTHRPCLRGNAAFLRISGTGRWAMENMTVVKERLGKQRL